MKYEILYYTCNTHLPEIDDLCREHLKTVPYPIISVSLNKEIDFGDKRIVMEGVRGPLMMHEQILAGLEASEADFIFLVESDVIYHPSHFSIVPEREDVYYFNTNVWKMRWSDGLCIWTDNCQQVSAIVASRKLLLDFFRNKVDEIKEKGFDRHYEPRNAPRVNWQSETPNVCIRHENNITKSKWSPDDYRNKENAKGWKESYEVPGWGKPPRV